MTAVAFVVRPRGARFLEVNGTELPAPRDGASPEGDNTGAVRSFARFALGLAALTRERMSVVLDISSAFPSPDAPPTDAPEPGSRPKGRDVAVGLALDAVERASRASQRLRARWSSATGMARRRAAPLARRTFDLARRAPGASRVTARFDAWRARGEDQLARWAAAGRRETADGRSLARGVLTTLRENAFARVSESPDLKRVIREQSEGIAVTAVSELRDRSARADSLAEGAVRRLLGRGPESRSR